MPVVLSGMPIHSRRPVPSGIPICPITQEQMKDPVIDPAGNSYERSAIIAWLERESTSPITRNLLLIDQLIPNRSLLEIIQGLSSCNKNLKNCFKCGKEIAVSSNYKGKSEPCCFKCRAWNCKSCTFTNDSGSTKCSMCNNTR